jgi:hypothetical protein
MLFLNIKNKSIQSNLAFWRQGKAQWVLMSLTIAILFMPSTLAKSLDKYCVSRIGQKQEPRKFDSYAENNPKQLTIRTHSGLFDVSVDHSSLVLKRKGSSTRLSEFKIPPNNYSLIIESITLTKGQWLWVNGFEIDFMIAVNTSATIPTFGKPTWFPKIYSRPCSMFADFFGNCLRAQGVYSKSLGRAFVEGHRVNFFGLPELTAYEMMEGKVKELPVPLQRATFLVDIPKLKGALFRGFSDEALFYDGSSVTTLLGAFPPSSPKNTMPKWYIHRTDTQRTFLTNLGFRNQPKYLLEELIAGPKLVPISFPVGADLLGLYSVPTDPRLWMVLQSEVLTEVKGHLQTVVRVNKPFIIYGPKDIDQSPDGTLAFNLINLKTKSMLRYSIKKTSDKKQCKTVLNEKKVRIQVFD